MPLERILVVESDDKIRDLMKRFLSGKGYEVVAVADAAEVTEVAEELKPDVCLVNVVVGDAKGQDVCAALREQDASTRLVAMGTARQKKRFSAKARARLGIEHFLMKPFSAAKLLEVFERLEQPEGAETEDPEDDGESAPPEAA